MRKICKQNQNILRIEILGRFLQKFSNSVHYTTYVEVHLKIVGSLAQIQLSKATNY